MTDPFILLGPRMGEARHDGLPSNPAERGGKGGQDDRGLALPRPDVHAQLRKMVAMGDVESAEMLVESTHSSTSWSASSSVWIRRERWGLSCSAGGGRCHNHGGEAHRPA